MHARLRQLNDLGAMALNHIALIKQHKINLTEVSPF